MCCFDRGLGSWCLFFAVMEIDDGLLEARADACMGDEVSSMILSYR